ncbi:MAG TPA: dihydroorotate dehydrogenase electron transfer subunit [Coriobacteriia bacterium]
MSDCGCAGDEARSVERVKVVANERLAAGIGLLTLHAPRIGARVAPGQFVHLRITRDADFILRRPFSVHGTTRDGIRILYQVLGRGTRALAAKRPGDEMDALGPLGKGFRIPEGVAHALLVGGGLGVAPLALLAEVLAERGVAVTAALGAPTADRLLALDVLEVSARQVLLATDDGSRGERGFVTMLVEGALAASAPDVAYVCGPAAMQRIVAAQCAAAGVPCQLSLERLMACGVGACLSCVVETASGLKRACCDGPVFDAEEVRWDVAQPGLRH